MKDTFTNRLIAAFIFMVATFGGIFFLLNSFEMKTETVCKTVGEQSIFPIEIKSVEPTESPEERAKRENDGRIAFEKAKAEWFVNNPPVKFLFEADRGYDNEYVIEYLKENKIAGDCALAWIPDVVCSNFGESLHFPTSRDPNN